MINQDLQLQLHNAGYKGEFELSELIEACIAIKPDELICIGHAMYDKDYFHAAFYENETVVGVMPKQTISVFGETLEEAVANLWLRINERHYN